MFTLPADAKKEDEEEKESQIRDEKKEEKLTDEYKLMKAFLYDRSSLISS